jgi:proteasome lid subunit RPN8/RPN11
VTDSTGHSDADSKAEIAEAGARRGINIEESAREAMHAHAEGTTSVEIGGVLVGDIDGETGDVFVLAAIPAHRATSAVASLTFTHEAWDEVNEIMSRDFEGLRMVGWYHSHPRFGIFLSEYDVFIQKNFFSEEWQVAYVVDPVSHTSGVFGWEHGEIVRYPEWNVVARGASKSVREPDRGEGARRSPINPTPPPPPVKVQLDDAGPAHAKAPPKSPGRSFIIGAGALLVVAVIALGVWLLVRSGSSAPADSAAAKASSTAATSKGSTQALEHSKGGSNGDGKSSSGTIVVPSSDAGPDTLSEHWTWTRTTADGPRVLIVTISLASTASDSLSGTIQGCAPVETTSVNPASLTANCGLAMLGAPLTAGMSEVFAFTSRAGSSTDLSALRPVYKPLRSGVSQESSAATPLGLPSPTLGAFATPIPTTNP